MSRIIIKEGWAGKFIGNLILLLHPTEAPRLIDIQSVEDGEHIPRETDLPLVADL